VYHFRDLQLLEKLKKLIGGDAYLEPTWVPQLNMHRHLPIPTLQKVDQLLKPLWRKYCASCSGNGPRCLPKYFKLALNSSTAATFFAKGAL
jgi:hypothetical protein